MGNNYQGIKEEIRKGSICWLEVKEKAMIDPLLNIECVQVMSDIECTPKYLKYLKQIMSDWNVHCLFWFSLQDWLILKLVYQ